MMLRPLLAEVSDSLGRGMRCLVATTLNWFIFFAPAGYHLRSALQSGLGLKHAIDALGEV